MTGRLRRRVKALEAAREPPKPPVILFQFPGEPRPPEADKPGFILVQCVEGDEEI